MNDLFFRNPRLVVLTIALILVGGLSSYYVLPRMEDPLLTERAALVTTRFPGADSQRVESLVTEKLEDALQEIDEIKELRSVSRRGVSTLSIELRDDIYEVETIWSRVRDKIGDVTPDLPQQATDPLFERLEVKAYALIVSLVWDSDQPTNYAILRRLAEQLDDELMVIPGTELVDTFGDPAEEILVQVDPSALTSLGINVTELSSRIAASDVKVSAGQLRGQSEFLLEIGGELKTLDRIKNIPVQENGQGGFVRLADIATIEKGIQQPQSTAAMVDGKPAVALGVLVRPSIRVDHWSSKSDKLLASYAASLPRGVKLQTVFQQNDFVEDRLTALLWNLILAAIAVTAVILGTMGWRSAVVIGCALPLSALMVLTGMRLLGIPIHQMSVTGLIIALGLLIDNAIVIVDEVNAKLAAGHAPGRAVAESTTHLALPLFGSTVTTALAFAPIALMPGPAGEFVGSIAVSVILAIVSSLSLALTVVPALAAYCSPSNVKVSNDSVAKDDDVKTRWSESWWWQTGVQTPHLSRAYHDCLNFVLARPVIGILIGVALPVAGFIQSRHLPEQFFPPGDRNQFQVELELGSQSSLDETLATAQRLREQVLRHPDVAQVTWFLGESAPSFYYNVIPRRRNTASYAQALVQLHDGIQPLAVIRQLQQELNQSAPECRILARQLEQGPPFDAPVELRVFGPDLDVLRDVGDQLRATLSRAKNVVHTRSDLSETVANLSFELDEEETRIAGLSHTAIANQLNQTLEGAVGGSVLEQTEELPVRVRVANDRRSDIDEIRSLELVAPDSSVIPISALGDIVIKPQSASIPRFNRRRMNEVQAYVTAGVLPATVVSEFRQLLDDADFQMPTGYQMEFGGEAAKRNDAIGNLLVNVGTLLVLMIATLVLSFKSFRMAAIIGAVAILSVGLGVGALWVFGYPFGFMAIVGTMGLIGIAINDAIVVLAAIRENDAAAAGDVDAVRDVVHRSTRHVVATSLTTVAGFIPLLLSGGGFWPPLAVSIAGGVGGATILALFFVPSAYLFVMCRGKQQPAETATVTEQDLAESHRETAMELASA